MVIMMDLESETREISSEITAEKEKNGGQVDVGLEEMGKSNFTFGEKLGAGGKVWSLMDRDAGKDNGCDLLLESGVVSEGDSSRNQCQNDEVPCFEQFNGNDGKIVDDDSCDIDFRGRDKDGDNNRKRKRECILKALTWVKRVAKDPCNQIIGSLPESSKWEYFGYEQPWKHVMLVRQEMMAKRNGNSSIEQSIWQKKQMMHPAMYDCSRYSHRIASAKMSQAAPSFKKPQAQSYSKSTSSDTQSDSKKSLAGFWLMNYKPNTIPVGINRQAEIPEWTETVSDSESKWLGKRIWPQEKGVNCNSSIERDPTGLGRPDQCDCEVQGSLECVRLHVFEKRMRLKYELGVAFYDWHFDKMGEDVALSWEDEEELYFEAIVKSHPPKEKRFWEEIRRFFPSKMWRQLVSYYYNVFLLRRRGLQNRCSLTEISSEDEALEFETTHCFQRTISGAVSSNKLLLAKVD